MRKVDIIAGSSPFCEHCGSLEDGSFSIKEKGVYWCIGCAFAGNLISNKKSKELHQQEIDSQIQALENKIAMLKAKKATP